MFILKLKGGKDYNSAAFLGTESPKASRTRSGYGT